MNELDERIQCAEKQAERILARLYALRVAKFKLEGEL